MPPPGPYVGEPTSQPSGGISETTADAATTQPTTEEGQVPVSNFYCPHILRVTEWSFGVRRPSGPDTPAVRDCPASTASQDRSTPRSCATGYRGKRTSKEFQASTRP
ncbi:hypothetical protein BDM02DRAFT_3000293 [Thelephora ganbajun]|uniref:Uncharacterized protein n=1 Tax=Thelephora ganbajun TaxID=370292 RepID=A0ACB6Z9Z5_THEGA|nr:hypothetical protein BDM02DRAFT_3000293 [Thelephora ganbajun]